MEEVFSVLAVLTESYTGAVIAVSEWKILDILKHVLVSISKITNRKIITTSLRTILSSSFFQLCAHLCQVDSSKATFFSYGFIRLSLEKLYEIKDILNETEEEYIRWERLRFQKQPLPVPSIDRLFAIGILTFVKNIANFTHPKYGNVNHLLFNITSFYNVQTKDQYNMSTHLLTMKKDFFENVDFTVPIFKCDSSSYYSVVDVCVSVLRASNRCPRNEKLFLIATETLYELSKDIAMFYDTSVERLDILSLVLEELNCHIKEYISIELSNNRFAMKFFVEIVSNIAQGISTPYIVSMSKELHLPLIKVARLFPEFEGNVRECIWKFTNMKLGTGKQFNHESLDEQIINEAMNEFIQNRNK